MCPKQVHEGSSDIHMFLSVVMIDWGNLRGQIFSRTGFAPSVSHAHGTVSVIGWGVRFAGQLANFYQFTANLASNVYLPCSALTVLLSIRTGRWDADAPSHRIHHAEHCSHQSSEFRDYLSQQKHKQARSDSPASRAAPN